MPGLRSFFHVEFPRPDVAGRTVCPACEGWGVSGERVERETTERLPLLADVMCRQCGGCGCADHEECPQGIHAGEPPYEQGKFLASYDAARDELVNPHGACSCREDRGFYYHMVHRRAPDGIPGWVLAVLRIPCACQAHRARVIPAFGPDIEIRPMWP